MPYILYKTNGNTLVTVDDGAVDTTTSLTFVGKNYSGYGQIQNENFVKLLENFANATAPAKPVQGQLWFDIATDNRRLNVCYDGKNFKSIASIIHQSTDPSLTETPSDGDFWWNTSTKQVNAWNGGSNSWVLVGPATSTEALSSWVSASETPQEDVEASYAILRANIGYTPIAVISDTEFTPLENSGIFQNFPTVKAGITLAGADANGSTIESGNVLWATAAESLRASTATSVAVNVTTTGTYYVPFASGYSGDQPLYSTSTITYNAYTQVLNATATSARYADLAERYEADDVYDVGTVLVIGGEKEVTVTTRYADTRVAGIVSKNPAYMMNSEAGSDETHPYIALKGRVPCKVVGTIKKGDLLVTSDQPGYAALAEGTYAGSVIGKALESHSEGFGIIEVLVV